MQMCCLRVLSKEENITKEIYICITAYSKMKYERCAQHFFAAYLLSRCVLRRLNTLRIFRENNAFNMPLWHAKMKFEKEKRNSV
jgi:hypothetical protein